MEVTNHIVLGASSGALPCDWLPEKTIEEIFCLELLVLRFPVSPKNEGLQST